MNNRLYIIPRFNYNDEVVKTHLARAYPFDYSLTPIIEKLCLPNIPIFLHNCECPAKCDGSCDGIEADTKWAEYWDFFFNEVSCQTCLKRARDGFNRNKSYSQENAGSKLTKESE